MKCTVKLNHSVVRMYQDWMLFVYSFSGVLSAKNSPENKILQCKFFKILTLIKIVLMITVNGGLLVHPQLVASLFRGDSQSDFWSSFTTNTVWVSSKFYHGFAIILLTMQFVKSERIFKYLELILIRSQTDEVFKTKIQKFSAWNLKCHIVFFLLCGLGRYLIVFRFDGFFQIFCTLIMVQTPLILFGMLGFISDMQKFIIFSYEDVEETIQIKNLRFCESLRDLEDVDEILSRFIDIFGAQLSTMAITYTLSTMFYVRLILI